jgi:hypothetical protein
VLLAWAGAQVLEQQGVPVPRVPVSAPLTILLLAAILLAIALSMRSRLAAVRDRRPDARPVNPLAAARAAVLAKASSPVGAVVVGVYLGYVVFLIPGIDIRVRRNLALMSGFAVLAGLALVASALFLEHVCRVPPPPEERTGRSVGDTNETA